MLNIVNKTDCCACSACYNICPKHCISMQADVEGFLYPVIDKSICVNCGLCEKVCPLLGAQETNLYLQLIIPQYFISNKSGIWSLSLIVHSKG